MGLTQQIYIQDIPDYSRFYLLGLYIVKSKIVRINLVALQALVELPEKEALQLVGLEYAVEFHVLKPIVEHPDAVVGHVGYNELQTTVVPVAGQVQGVQVKGHRHTVRPLAGPAVLDDSCGKWLRWFLFHIFQRLHEISGVGLRLNDWSQGNY